jgi:hypothetical protein
VGSAGLQQAVPGFGAAQTRRNYVLLQPVPFTKSANSAAIDRIGSTGEMSALRSEGIPSVPSLLPTICPTMEAVVSVSPPQRTTLKGS